MRGGRGEGRHERRVRSVRCIGNFSALVDLNGGGVDPPWSAMIPATYIHVARVSAELIPEVRTRRCHHTRERNLALTVEVGRDPWHRHGRPRCSPTHHTIFMLPQRHA